MGDSASSTALRNPLFSIDEIPRGKTLELARRTCTVIFTSLLALILLRGWLWRYPPAISTRTHALDYGGGFGFGDFPASRQLEWHPCFKEMGPTYQCARLVVPLITQQQATLSNDELNVELALVMLPGRNCTHHSQYSPTTLLFNPGGPGTSGVDVILWLGSYIQKIVGLDQDIIAFDPRGIGYTRPRADCWTKSRTPESSKDIWNIFILRQTWGVGIDTMRSITNIAFNHAISFLDAQVRAVSRLCDAMHTELGDSSIFPHLGNTHTARDILRIIDVWDDWRSSDPVITDHGLDESLSRKLVYWGFSYGTFLGATFAAMFPNRVGRIILDGAIDAVENVGPYWMNNTRDADKALVQFFHFCYKAKEACDFYRFEDSVDDIKQRYLSIMSFLEDSPQGFVDMGKFRPIVITSAHIKARIFASLYSPAIHGFPDIARVLNAAHEMNWGELLELSEAPDFPALCSAGNSEWSSLFAHYLPDDSNVAIACADMLHPDGTQTDFVF
ncbi:hypothetical protein S40293_07901 [Stachybotrys chartarum IBT 40293]|nr:hypothetical protein S40293_07901 [Stachybotrys chartarum IBT 40293]